LKYAEVLSEVKGIGEEKALTIVGWFADEEGRISIVANAGAEFVKNTAAESMVVAGVGSTDGFLRAFGNAVKGQRDYEEWSSVTDPKLHWLALAGSLHALEVFQRADSDTIKASIGGGYECIFWNDKSFQKADDWTVAAWEIALDPRRSRFSVNGPFHVCKMLYDLEALMLHVVGLGGEDASGATYAARNRGLWVAAPIPDAFIPDEADCKALPLDSQAICCVFFPHVNGQWGPPFLFLDIGNALMAHGHHVYFELTGDSASATMDDELKQYLAGESQRLCVEWTEHQRKQLRRR
jgi:hypothetical protein